MKNYTIEYQSTCLFLRTGSFSAPYPQVIVFSLNQREGCNTLAGEGGRRSQFGRLERKAWHSVYSVGKLLEPSCGWVATLGLGKTDRF
jgi:hypothetical protein